jgi:hypothetical protein
MNINMIEPSFNLLIKPEVDICDVYNIILDRNNIIQRIICFLEEFDETFKDITIKRSMYIYGNIGIGKTSLLNNILKSYNYDIIHYNSSNIRTKQNLLLITNNNMCKSNIMNMFYTPKHTVILMDEIDSMNTGDKGGLNKLIQIVRPKKSKKQKIEDNTQNPIFIISNYYIDKKNKELNNVCISIELNTPTHTQMFLLIKVLLVKKYNIICDDKIINEIVIKSTLNLHIMNSIINIFNNIYVNSTDKNTQYLLNKLINILNVIHTTTQVYNTKKLTMKFVNDKVTFNTYNTILNETDKTTVGLLYHENIIDVISKLSINKCELYYKILHNICFADYIDRIIFQKQIWQLNTLSSIIKIYNNNYIMFNNNNNINVQINNSRFTKILTKYSTEYNNCIFIIDLCQRLNLDINDLFSFFISYKSDILNILNIDSNEIKNTCLYTFKILVNIKIITNIDIKRIYKYIEYIYK